MCGVGHRLVHNPKHALVWFRPWAEKRTKPWDRRLLLVFYKNENRSLHYELEILEEERESGCVSVDEGVGVDCLSLGIWGKVAANYVSLIPLGFNIGIHHTLVGILSKGKDCLQAYHQDHLMQVWKDWRWRWHMHGLGLAPRLH